MKTSASRLSRTSLLQWWNRVENFMTTLYRLHETTSGAPSSESPHRLNLVDGDILQLRSGSPSRHLRVRQGVVWLTRTPAEGDILLKAGEEITLDHGWPIVVQALHDSRVDVWH